MGKQIIDTLLKASKPATELDEAMRKLPESNRPSWSLVEGLSRDVKSSRLQEAVFPQPLCTVIQVILVDILRAASIKFSAVAGHWP